MSRQTISCAIVVFNEEKNIADCLNTATWMDEIVVVDAFSIDRTVEICKTFTERIFQRPWNGFGEQKNFAIQQSTSDWVFILDADERITPELRLEMEAVLEGKDAESLVVYSVPRRNYIMESGSETRAVIRTASYDYFAMELGSLMIKSRIISLFLRGKRVI